MGTYVLVHGAYQGGWIWQRVVPLLQAQGHRVLAPTLDGCAERRQALRAGITTESHAQEVAELLFFEDVRDVVLVGTSTGGMVACRTAEIARDRVGRIVLADALALFNGERLSDHVQRPSAVTTTLATGPSPEDAEKRMFASLDPEAKAWALARYTPHPIAAMADPVRLQGFWDLQWNAMVIWCRQSPNPPLPHQRRAAERLGARWAELDTGHYPMLTQPEQLSTLIMAG